MSSRFVVEMELEDEDTHAVKGLMVRCKMVLHSFSEYVLIKYTCPLMQELWYSEEQEQVARGPFKNAVLFHHL